MKVELVVKTELTDILRKQLYTRRLWSGMFFPHLSKLSEPLICMIFMMAMMKINPKISLILKIIVRI